MGKKNYDDYDYDDGSINMYDQERNNEIADHLEAYVDAVSTLFIIDGKKEDDVKSAIKTVRKACKNLREGKPEKVFDLERFEEYASMGR